VNASASSLHGAKRWPPNRVRIIAAGVLWLSRHGEFVEKLENIYCH